MNNHLLRKTAQCRRYPFFNESVESQSPVLGNALRCMKTLGRDCDAVALADLVRFVIPALHLHSPNGTWHIEDDVVFDRCVHGNARYPKKSRIRGLLV